MNSEHLEFQISELYDHVSSLLEEIREGKMKEDSDGALEVDLGHFLDHICLAWNLRDNSVEQTGDIDQVEFERATNTIPNFGLNRSLLDGTYYENKAPIKTQ